MRAVRLTEKKGVLHLAAIGFIPPPAGELPRSWESAAKSCAWSIPSMFQAPRAALAVTSEDMYLAQTTRDAFKADFTAGAHLREAAPKVKKFSLHRASEEKAEASDGEKAEEEKSAAVSEFEWAPGVPLSNGGSRFVMKPLASSDDFVMEALLPEYQVLWLSRLLVEGRRPTAASIQLRTSAILGSVLRQPLFRESEGSALVLFASAHEVHIAGYDKGDIVLWRACRALGGLEAIHGALKKELGLDDAMVAAVLEDTLIDPRPVLEPILAPMMDELAMSRDYLVGKLGVEPKCALLMGVGAGAKYFAAIAEERAHLTLQAGQAFDGFVVDDHTYVGEGAAVTGDVANEFLGALGAALALVGEEG